MEENNEYATIGQAKDLIMDQFNGIGEITGIAKIPGISLYQRIVVNNQFGSGCRITNTAKVSPEMFDLAVDQLRQNNDLYWNGPYFGFSKNPIREVR